VLKQAQASMHGGKIFCGEEWREDLWWEFVVRNGGKPRNAFGVSYPIVSTFFLMKR
jgi:hypothetical protein